MTLLGNNLKAPKLAAIVLEVYAIGYGTLLFIVGAAAISEPMVALFFFGLLALATTPFIALTHLNRITEKSDGPPARPIVMAFVMAAPAAFWLYGGGGVSLEPFQYRQDGDLMLLFVFLIVPGLLSLWLSVTFAVLAMQGRRKDADIE